MATFSARKLSETSIMEQLTDCNSSGDNFYNSGIEFIKFVNDHASAHYTITITPNVTSVTTSLHGTMTKAATTINIEDGEEAYVGPFKPSVWNDSSNKINITYNVTGGTDAISTISSGTHALKAELLFLDPK